MKFILKYHCHLKAETTNTKVIFGEAKEYMGLRVAKFGRLWNVDEQFLCLNSLLKKSFFLRPVHGLTRAKYYPQACLGQTRVFLKNNKPKPLMA